MGANTPKTIDWFGWGTPSGLVDVGVDPEALLGAGGV